MREDYLQLNKLEDKQAIEAFDHFFNADQFRREYHIRILSGETNKLRWGPLQDWPEFERYWLYMAPLAAVPLDQDSMFHMRHAGPSPPVTAENLEAALSAGYAHMNDDKPVPELVGHSGVLAARQGQPSEGALYLTLVVELHDEQFAIGSLMGAEHRPKVVRHLTRLLDTKKSASQAEE